MNELWRKSALEIARDFKSGEVSAGEIVEAHLARIDEVNPALNAVVWRMDEEARTAAASLDKTRASGGSLGPLAGVPFTIKKNIDLAGHPTTHGLPMFAEACPSQDAPVVSRMRAAGGIPIGRTNMPDLGLRMHTDSALYGLTKNPWCPGRTAGGSSGGEGVALAAGMSALGLGNDLGGSLRSPATCCSIASIKPTVGLVPHVSEVNALPPSIMMQLLSVAGPMARTVADVRAGLHVMAGPDPRDPWCAPVPLKTSHSKRRVALLAEPPGGSTDARVAQVARATADALAQGGVEVMEVDVPLYEEVLRCWEELVIGSLSFGIDTLAPMVSADAYRFLLQGVEAKGPFTLEAVTAAWGARFGLAAAWASFFTEFDAILTPTWTELPYEIGFDIQDVQSTNAALNLIRPALPANVLGLPSVAVPAGLADGLPVGVLLTGPAWSDMICLELAEVIERSGLAPGVPNIKI